MPIDFLKQNIFLVSLVLISGGMLLWPLIFRSGAKAVSSNEATMLINREEAVVVDVRSAAEYAEGHIPGSINLPADRVGERLGELEKFRARPIIVTCQTGIRAGGACSKLKKGGFERLYELTGGLGAWQQAGLPVKKGKAAR
jgi:rhodanese-related sulfurtransferase